MVRYVPDRTGRFTSRPYFAPEELDEECQRIIVDFLQESHGTPSFPISTADLTRLIEREAKELDHYADLSEYGRNVEGATEFWPGSRPVVRISKDLANDPRRENRLRTTLSHEYGHVHFHGSLWETDTASPGLVYRGSEPTRWACRREAIYNAPQSDWMEWQAGYVCGALLMPVTRVRALAKEDRETRGPMGVPGRTSKRGQALITATRKAFQVSAEAAQVRLHQLNLLK